MSSSRPGDIFQPDDLLNNTSVHFLKWGTFIYLAISYWMISNKQMFGNTLEPKHYQDEVDIYHHYFHGTDTYTFQYVLKWAAIILGICLALYDIFIGWLNMFSKSSAKDELKSKEKLLDYPDCVPLKYIENALLEEKIIREKFGYK